MTNSSVKKYENMTSKEKDDVCDRNHELIQDLIRSNEVNDSNSNNNLQKNGNKTKSDERINQFKRQLTSTSQIGDDDSNEDDENPFIVISKGNKRKQKTVVNSPNDNDLNEQRRQKCANNVNSRLFINSRNKTNINNYSHTHSNGISHQQYQKERINNNNGTRGDDDSDMTNTLTTNLLRNYNVNDKNNEYNNYNNHINISQHALSYAVEQHLPPIHIQCTPKISDHNKGKDIIKGLFAYIEKDFKKLNKNYSIPLGFEYWYIDKNQDLLCYTKQVELFVYLCDSQNYPASIAQVNIIPSRPKHLPSQHSLILKYVPNYITLNEIQDEISLLTNFLFNIEEMNGSKTDKSRHLRLEIKSMMDYSKLLKNGGLTIDGHLIELHEFLAPPRLLICSKCNDPGHIRRNCNLAYDACRRCGQDRSIGNHNECIICCHRCKQNHLATDYKCQFLIDYRRSLLTQLKQKPYLLPPNVQLFIPTEYRDRGDMNNKNVSNKVSNNINKLFNNTNNNQHQQSPSITNSHNWPSLSNHQNNHKNVTMDNSIWIELEKKQNEIDKLKEEMNNKIQKCQSRYEDHMNKLKSIFQIMSAQVKYQNDNVERCYLILNDILPLLSSSLALFQKMNAKITEPNISDINNIETQQLINCISKTIECIEERNNSLISSHKSLHSLFDQQGQLIVKAINSLELNNE